ncbi:hypothetical protein V3C99_007332, partial [Haemonchus contortus]
MVVHAIPPSRIRR